MTLSSLQKQQGVALMTVLLIIALATTLVVQFTSRQQIHLYRTSNLIHSDQAYQFALAAEQWGVQILQEDHKQNQRDDLNEGWNREIDPIQVEGGTVWGKITGLQGRFNLNNLVDGDKLNGEQLTILRHLLERNRLSPEIADQLTDWIDPDHDSSDYGGLESYGMANIPMTHPSELLLIEGVDATVYRTLSPLISTLPGNTRININTAPAEIIEMLHAAITTDISHRLVERREREPFNSSAEFLKQLQQQLPVISADELSTIDSLVTVHSSHFLLTIRANIGKGRRVLKSYLFRGTDGKTVVRYRTFGV